jgi:DNA-binding MltR family transcriptional regulator
MDENFRVLNPQEVKQLEDFHNELVGQSDRALAIVSAAELDNDLRELISSFLIVENKIVSDLFGNYKPLGPFGSKIQMAYCLGLISELEYNNLTIIQKVRNDFAHRLGLDFASDPIRNRCANIKFDFDQPPYPAFDLSDFGFDTSRDWFTAAVFFLRARVKARTFLIRNERRTKPGTLPHPDPGLLQLSVEGIRRQIKG